MNSPLPDRIFYTLLGIGLLLNATGLVPLIMEPDGALYASIAKTMAQSGDFVGLYAEGKDWLDKPHFPFWMTALSFLVFGVNSFAYKLPALLFWGMGVAYTYRFARLSYSKLVAQVATLVVLTPYHLVLSNNDVRAEPYLTGLIIAAVYHFFKLYKGGAAWNLVAGAALAAGALMTKGPFVLVPVGAGLVLHWVLTGNWRELLRPRWIGAVLLTLVFTLPELLTLYLQFDQHPEKVVFGRPGVSGVRFFFWDSQFGRFFNTGPIRGAGDPFFFLHTLLWAFLPWSPLLYAAVGTVIAGLIRGKKPVPELVSLGSGLATFLLFSASSFQLPHYLNIVFPFYAVLVAQFLVGRSTRGIRAWTRVQTGIGILMAVLAVILLVLFRPEYEGLAVSWLVLAGLGTLFFFQKSDLLSLLGRTTGASVLLYGFLNLFLFRDMLRYQAGGEAAFFLNNQPKTSLPIGLYGEVSHSFAFYLHAPVNFWMDDNPLPNTPVLVFTAQENLEPLRQKGFTVKTLGEFPYFHVSQPSLEFLTAETRESVLEPYVVAEVKKE